MAINQVILTGRLTHDVDCTTASNGTTICKFSIAVERRFKQEGQQEADFINIITFKSLADNCFKFLKKGSKVGVVGSIQTRTYDGKDGTKRYAFEILANEVEFLTPKTESTDPIRAKAEAEKQEIMKGFTPIDEDSLPF